MKAGNIKLSRLLSLLGLVTLMLILATSATTQSHSKTKQLKAFSLEENYTASPAKPTQEHEPEAPTLAHIQRPYLLASLNSTPPNNEALKSSGKSHAIRAPPLHA